MTEGHRPDLTAGSSRLRDEGNARRAQVDLSSVLPRLLDMRSRAWFGFGRHQPTCVDEAIDPVHTHRGAFGSSCDVQHPFLRP